MTEQKNFKTLEQELNNVLERIENSEYDDLDEMLKDYESGKKLIIELEKRLETAKNKIKKVS